MRKTQTVYTLIVTLMIGMTLPSLSFAEEKEKETGKSADKKKGPSKEMLEKYDADKDGVLSEEEKAVMKTERKAEMLKKYDTDGNGELSKEEKMKMNQDRKKEMGDKRGKKADKKGGEKESDDNGMEEAGE